jgi:predicted small lipoprotein YifL
MRLRTLLPIVLLGLVVLVALTACGGGGGGY